MAKLVIMTMAHAKKGYRLNLRSLAVIRVTMTVALRP
jgi:hypothetical protein